MAIVFTDTAFQNGAAECLQKHLHSLAGALQHEPLRHMKDLLHLKMPFSKADFLAHLSLKSITLEHRRCPQFPGSYIG